MYSQGDGKLKSISEFLNFKFNQQPVAPIAAEILGLFKKKESGKKPVPNKKRKNREETPT